MGCFSSKNEHRASRIARWNATGIVALRHSNIKVLPDEVLEVNSYVRTIDLTANKVAVLTPDISKLVHLQRLLCLLNVSSNKLNSLPTSIGSCTSLEELQANENEIDELPESMCALSQLKSLTLNHNRLGKLPQNLLKGCKSLQTIALHCNPISVDQFQQMPGFVEFEDRRRRKFDKQIDSNVLMNSKGLDEGIDL